MIDIYEIKDNYVEYLRITKGFNKVYDPKILVRSHERKYIGIVLKINNYNYFAPFSSPKKSDYNMQGKYRDEGVVSRTKGILSNGTGNFRLC